MKSLLKVYGAAAIWSTIGPVSIGDPLSTSFARLAFAGISSAPFFRWSKEILLLGFIIFPFYISYVLSVNSIGVPAAAALLYTAPAWVSLYHKLRGEGKLLPAALAFLGVWLIAGSPTVGPLGALIGLVPGLLYAANIVYSKELMKEREPTDVLGGQVVAGLLSLSLLPFVKISARLLLVGVYLGFVCSTLAYYLFYSGLKELEAWHAAVAATLEPALAAVWGCLMGQTLNLSGWIGFSLIVLSQLTANS